MSTIEYSQRTDLGCITERVKALEVLIQERLPRQDTLPAK